MKMVWVLFLFLLGSCVIVVKEEAEPESDSTDYRYRERNICGEDPYPYAPDYCDVYYARECCDWYVGNGCYETWCYAYRDDCEEGWQHIYNSC